MSHPRTQCDHAQVGSRASLVKCMIGECPDNSHVGVCRGCPSYTGPSRGLGDTIARFTQVTGIDKAVKTATSIASAVTGKKKDCGCGGRRKALNQVVPYKPPCDGCDKSGKPD